MPIGAIFDLDGTIIDCSSERRFVKHLILTRRVPLWNWLSWCGRLLIERSMVKAKANKVYLRGQSVAEITHQAERFFHGKLEAHISPRARALLREHRENQHLTFLLSGSLDCFVRLFSEHLSMDAYVGFELETQDGYFTGKTQGIQPYAEGKAILLRQMAQDYELDLSASYAYGNHATDALVLELVGNPVAVNPDSALVRTAQNRGWKVESFHPGKRD